MLALAARFFLLMAKNPIRSGALPRRGEAAPVDMSVVSKLSRYLGLVMSRQECTARIRVLIPIRVVVRTYKTIIIQKLLLALTLMLLDILSIDS